MKRVAPLLALLLAVALPVSVTAHPRRIADLSEGALLGQIRNTAQLQQDFSAQRPLLADATIRLGLTHRDFVEVASDIANGRARYVEIPRHLDGMAGKYRGRAFAVHDIVIPPHVYGWEVDLQRSSGIVRVFMPNRCGNMSYLVVPRRQILAAAPIPHVVTPSPVTLAAIAAPTPAMLPPSPAPVIAMAAPVTPAIVAPAAHHLALLPWLAAGLITAFLTMHHGGSPGTPGFTAPRAVPTPAPIHTVCPPQP